MPVIEVLGKYKCADGDAFRLRDESWIGSSHIRKPTQRVAGEHRRPESTMQQLAERNALVTILESKRFIFPPIVCIRFNFRYNVSSRL